MCLKFLTEANASIFLMKQGQIKTGAPCRSERLAKYNQARILFVYS
jgi:enolase